METAVQSIGKQRLTKGYLWTIVAAGAVAFAYSAYWLPMPRIDLRFMMLTGIMMFVSSRLSVQIPRVNTNVTVSDTFIFLVLLVYGGFAGIARRFNGADLRSRMPDQPSPIRLLFDRASESHRIAPL